MCSSAGGSPSCGRTSTRSMKSAASASVVNTSTSSASAVAGHIQARGDSRKNGCAGGEIALSAGGMVDDQPLRSSRAAHLRRLHPANSDLPDRTHGLASTRASHWSDVLMWGKSVSPNAIIGGTIQNAGYWEPIEVLGTDGLMYEASIVNGHSGPEFHFTETRASIAQRAAKTRAKRKGGT